MKISTSRQFRWAKPAFVTPNDLCIDYLLEGWFTCEGRSADTLNTSSFLPNSGSIEQSDWSTLDGISPSKFCSDYPREVSIPVEQLKDELLWPEQHPRDYEHQRKDSVLCQSTQQSSPKRRRSSMRTISNSTEASETTAPQLVVNVEPMKRKRGRPRLYSPTLEIAEPDAPFSQVLSARKSQLEKNRVAANKCRQHRREYIVELTAKASEISSKNAALKAELTVLREQVLGLKNKVLSHARCGSWAIDRYVARSAGDLYGGESPPRRTSEPTTSNHIPLSTSSTDFPGDLDSETTSQSQTSQDSTDVQIEMDDHDSLWLLNDDYVMEDL